VARRLRTLANDYEAIATLLSNADTGASLHVVAPPMVPRPNRHQS
jgi:hypothetical protein